MYCPRALGCVYDVPTLMSRSKVPNDADVRLFRDTNSLNPPALPLPAE